MRSLKSLSVIALVAFALTACSGSKNNRDIEQGTEQSLSSTAQAYLQDGDYAQAIRYLEAVNQRYPDTVYSEQAHLNLIYAYYKKREFDAALTAADRYIQLHPTSQHLDYVLYMAGLTNASLGDNYFQNLFGVDRATRESTSIKAAFANFQNLVQHFPYSPYRADAIARMAYIKASLARHELEIAKFYFKRDAYVAVANRVAGMLRDFPDTQATLDALPLMKESYERMNLKTLAEQTERIIQANAGKQIADPDKPKEVEIVLPQ